MRIAAQVLSRRRLLLLVRRARLLICGLLMAAMMSLLQQLKATGPPPPPPGRSCPGRPATWPPRVPVRRRYRQIPGPGRPWPSPTGPVQTRGGWRPEGSAPGPGPGRRRASWQKSPRGTIVAATRSLPDGAAAPAGPIRSARPQPARQTWRITRRSRKPVPGRDRRQPSCIKTYPGICDRALRSEFQYGPPGCPRAPATPSTPG